VASPAKPAEFEEFGEFGDWKPKTENWKLKKNSLFPSRQQLPKKIKIILFLFLFLFFASARTRFLPRRWTVKTRPWVKPRPRGKRGRAQTSGRHPQTSGRKGRPDSNFPRKSSFMTSLLWSLNFGNFFFRRTSFYRLPKKTNSRFGFQGIVGIDLLTKVSF
jgi:hypothetical protein